VRSKTPGARTRWEPVAWFLAGFVAALFLQSTQASAVGGWAGLLQVGEDSSARSLIESELGDVPLTPGGGHDGQISYVIGLDLFGNNVPELLDHGGYRYRRILYPVVASLGGLLEGEALLWGLVAVAAGGFGLAVAATASLASSLGLRAWATLGILANPGAWLAVRLLTPDALALGLLLTALAAVVRRQHVVALLLMVGLGLTKDQYLISALAVGGWYLFQRKWQLAALYGVVPITPIFLWAWWLDLQIDGGFTPRGNLSLPLQGVIDSARRWADAPTADAVLAILTLATVAVGIFAGWKLRDRWIGPQLLAWSGLAMVSSSWVWDFGNNVARAFSPLLVFAVFAIAMLGKQGCRRAARRAAPSAS